MSPNRRKFIKDSAIIGAAVTAPLFLAGKSGMYSDKKYRSVHRILSTTKVNVGTLPVLRAFAGDQNDYVSPFVLFDEFGPVNIIPGHDALKVDAHPHAGVIPTTYFLSGSGHHKDSLDYDFQINTGEFMMFSSGSGAIHMEESGDKLKKEGGTLHGFQIWLNMPQGTKWQDPSTSVYGPQFMPSIKTEDYSVKVIMGNLFGAKSTIETHSPTFYYHIKLNEGKRLDIPTDPNHNAFAYMVKGDLEIEDQKSLKENHVALYQRGKSEINFYSECGAEFFLLGGKPLNEVVYSYGPFVMNNEQEIARCMQNYRSGKMGDPEVVNR
jgi:redox-sensitive bicupin YhaK (pirin superfamily)